MDAKTTWFELSKTVFRLISLQILSFDKRVLILNSAVARYVFWMFLCKL